MIPRMAPPGWRRLERPAWLALGLALLAFAIFEVVVHDLGPALIIVFVILPDLAFLAGAGQPHERGQLPPRAVPAYNLAHRPAIPLVLIALSLAALLAIRIIFQSGDAFEAARRPALLAYVAGIAWLVHIAFDRALGFGVRGPDGRVRD